MKGQTISSAFAQEVIKRPQLQHAAVRLGLWIAAVAEQQGGFPVTCFLRNFKEGLHTDLIDADGVSFRDRTITASLESLEAEGLLQIGTLHVGGRHAPKQFTLTVPQ